MGEGKSERGRLAGHGAVGLHCFEDHVINRCLEMSYVLVLLN